jgi:hypothetical protein
VATVSLDTDDSPGAMTRTGGKEVLKLSSEADTLTERAGLSPSFAVVIISEGGLRV